MKEEVVISEVISALLGVDSGGGIGGIGDGFLHRNLNDLSVLTALADRERTTLPPVYILNDNSRFGWMKSTATPGLHSQQNALVISGTTPSPITVTASASMLKNVLSWFAELASRLQICRVWAQLALKQPPSGLALASEKINSLATFNRRGHSLGSGGTTGLFSPQAARPDGLIGTMNPTAAQFANLANAKTTFFGSPIPGMHTTEQDGLPVEDSSHIAILNRELACLQQAIHELLSGIEDELCKVDAQLHITLQPQRSVTNSHQSLGTFKENPRPVTLLSFYRQCRKWDSMCTTVVDAIVSLYRVGLIWEANQGQEPLDTDTASVGSVTSSPSKSGQYNSRYLAPPSPGRTVKRRQCRRHLEVCFRFLCALEGILHRGLLVEAPHLRLSHPFQPTPESIVSAGRSIEFIHQRDQRLLRSAQCQLDPNLDFSLLSVYRNEVMGFVKAAFGSLLERLLRSLMKRVWAPELRRQPLDVADYGGKQGKALSQQDFVMLSSLRQAVGPQSFLHPLLAALELTAGDFDIIFSRISANSSSNLASNASSADTVQPLVYSKFSKVQMLNLLRTFSDRLSLELSHAEQAAVVLLTTEHEKQNNSLASAMFHLQDRQQAQALDRLSSLHSDLSAFTTIQTKLQQQVGDSSSGQSINNFLSGSRNAANWTHQLPLPVQFGVMQELRDFLNVVQLEQVVAYQRQQAAADIRSPLLQNTSTATYPNDPTTKNDSRMNSNSETLSITAILSQNNPSVNYSPTLVPMSRRIDDHFLQPLTLRLHQIRQESAACLLREFHLISHVRFLRKVFLLVDVDLFRPMRAICEQVVYAGCFSNRRKTVPDDAPGHKRRGTGANCAAAHSRLAAQERRYETLSRSALLNSLRHTLDVSVADAAPRGLKHISVSLPSTLAYSVARSEVIDQSRNFKPGGESSIFTSSHLPKSAFRQRTLSSNTPSSLDLIDESLIEWMVSQITVELHYQWPLNTMFRPIIISQLQSIQHFLLRITCWKWCAELWWKRIFSDKVGSRRTYHEKYSVRRTRQKRSSGRFMGLGDTLKTSGSAASLASVVMVEEEMEDPELKEARRSLDMARRACECHIFIFMRSMESLDSFFQMHLQANLWNKLEDILANPSVDSAAVLRYEFETTVQTSFSFLQILSGRTISLLTQYSKAIAELRRALTTLAEDQPVSYAAIAFEVTEIAFTSAAEQRIEIRNFIMELIQNAATEVFLSTDLIRSLDILQSQLV